MNGFRQRVVSRKMAQSTQSAFRGHASSVRFPPSIWTLTACDAQDGQVLYQRINLSLVQCVDVLRNLHPESDGVAIVLTPADSPSPTGIELEQST